MSTHERAEDAPVAERVAVNVATLRESRRLSVRGLSARLAELGRPILPSGVTKVEQGRRRVDADDLVALALALDVTPARLLLPPVAGGEEVTLTPSAVASAATAWAWACGERQLDDPWATGEAFDLDRARRFRVENRPHDPAEALSLDEMDAHREVLAALSAAVAGAQAEGLSLADVLAYVRLTDTARRVTDRARELAAEQEQEDGE